jgi:hypothetical protein
MDTDASTARAQYGAGMGAGMWAGMRASMGGDQRGIRGACMGGAGVRKSLPVAMSPLTHIHHRGTYMHVHGYSSST